MMSQADLDKLKVLSRKYAEAKEEYQRAKQSGASEEELKRLRRLRDNARKRFQQAL